MATMADPTMSAFPKDESNIFEWSGHVQGIEKPYAGRKYSISISFPANYPFSAPTVKFTDPIFHPNVDVHGNICLDILKVLSMFLHHAR